MAQFESILSWVIIALFVSFAWAPLLISMLYKYRIIRHVKHDFSTISSKERLQKAGTPIMGGLLIVVTVAVLTLLFNWNSWTAIPIITFLIAAVFGGLDDILNIFGRKRVIRTVKKQLVLARVHKKLGNRIWYWLTLPWTAYRNVWFFLGSYPGTGIHASERFLVQVLNGGIVAWWIYFHEGISEVWLPWIGTFDIGILMPFLIIFTIVAVANAVNITDGMDGLSSGTLLAAFSGFLILALLNNQLKLGVLYAVTIGSLLTYVYFNIKPARFQMADVGSLALGTLLATTAIMQGYVFLIPIIGAVYVLEVGSSLVQSFFRLLFGRRLLKMAPLHHHFTIVGWSEEKVVMRFWLFAVIFMVIGVWLGLQ